MGNQQKIITMTKLALYDKHEGTADRAANDYFRHDYIYRKNLGTRLSVGFGGMIILAFYWLRVVFIEGVDVFELYIQHHLFQSIVFILALMAVYSLIGTIQGTREYYLVQKRLERYQGMMLFLERVDERGRIRMEEKSKSEAKADTAKRERIARERTAPRPAPPVEARSVGVRRITPSDATPQTPASRESSLVRRQPPQRSQLDDRTRPIVRPASRPGDTPLVRLKREDS